MLVYDPYVVVKGYYKDPSRIAIPENIELTTIYSPTRDQCPMNLCAHSAKDDVNMMVGIMKDPKF